MSFELMIHLTIDTLVTFLMLYIILKHRKEAEKFYSQSRSEWEERQKYEKTLEQRLDNHHVLSKSNKTCFIGVGGGGCNIIQDMAEIDNRHKFIHLNSDSQALQLKTSKHKLLLGFDKKAGLGCGGKAQCGKDLVNDDVKTKLLALTKDEKIVYVVATLGGGVGSGATPEIVEYLKTLDKEIVVFAIMPFTFEGKMKASVAVNSISKIRSSIENVVIIKNDDLILNCNPTSGNREIFKMTSNIIYKRIADGI